MGLSYFYHFEEEDKAYGLVSYAWLLYTNGLYALWVLLRADAPDFGSASIYKFGALVHWCIGALVHWCQCTTLYAFGLENSKIHHDHP